MSQKHNDFSPLTLEKIALCTYRIREKEVRPSGRIMEHWLQAETQLLACRAHDKWTAMTATSDGPARDGTLYAQPMP